MRTVFEVCLNNQDFIPRSSIKETPVGGEHGEKGEQRKCKGCAEGVVSCEIWLCAQRGQYPERSTQFKNSPAPLAMLKTLMSSVLPLHPFCLAFANRGAVIPALSLDSKLHRADSPNLFEEGVLGVELLQRQEGQALHLALHLCPQALRIGGRQEPRESGDLGGKSTEGFLSSDVSVDGSTGLTAPACAGSQ